MLRRVQLEKNLGIDEKQSPKQESVPHEPIASPDFKQFKEPSKHLKELNEEKRRSARRKEYVHHRVL